MSVQTAYQVKTDVFEGPFDILLKAIDDGQIDIHRVSLAQITASYFAYRRAGKPPVLSGPGFFFFSACLFVR